MFQRLLTSGIDRNNLAILALLANQECIQFFIQQYEDDVITDNDVWGFQSYLSWKNHQLFLIFNKLINEVSGEKFKLQPMRNYEEERRTRLQNDFDFLFDKEAFLKEINLIYAVTGKQVLSSEELKDIATNNVSETQFSYLALNILRDITKKESITFENIIKIINDWDWDQFCINQTYHYLQRNKEITISNAQKQWISDWCISHLKSANFKTALKEDNGQTSTTWSHVFLWYFFRRLSLNYPKTILLDMLSFDWFEHGQWIGIQYLEEELSQIDIAKRVLDNLHEGIEIDRISENHMKYCLENKIIEVLPFIFNEITNTARSHSTRRIALELIILVAKDPAVILEPLLLKITDDFKWNIIDLLIKIGSENARNYLYGILKSGNKKEQLKAAKYLIQLQDLKGLQYYIKWVTINKRVPTHDIGGSPILSLQTIDSVPLLLELLKIGYQDNIVQDTFHRIDNIVLRTLSQIALQSENNYFYIDNALKAFIEKHTETIKNVNFLNVFLEDLEQRHYTAKSDKIEVDEAIRLALDTVN